MELRRGDIAGLARSCDHLTAFDGIAFFDLQFGIVGIGGDKAVVMTHQNRIAIAFQLVARIGDNAVFGSLDRRAFGQSDVDAIALFSGLFTEAFQDMTARRPAEFGCGRG